MKIEMKTALSGSISLFFSPFRCRCCTAISANFYNSKENRYIFIWFFRLCRHYIYIEMRKFVATTEPSARCKCVRQTRFFAFASAPYAFSVLISLEKVSKFMFCPAKRERVSVRVENVLPFQQFIAWHQTNSVELFIKCSLSSTQMQSDPSPSPSLSLETLCKWSDVVLFSKARTWNNNEPFFFLGVNQLSSYARMCCSNAFNCDKKKTERNHFATIFHITQTYAAVRSSLLLRRRGTSDQPCSRTPFFL